MLSSIVSLATNASDSHLGGVLQQLSRRSWQEAVGGGQLLLHLRQRAARHLLPLPLSVRRAPLPSTNRLQAASCCKPFCARLPRWPLSIGDQSSESGPPTRRRASPLPLWFRGEGHTLTCGRVWRFPIWLVVRHCSTHDNRVTILSPWLGGYSRQSYAVVDDSDPPIKQK